jgi:hypothetical protein
MHRPLDVLQLFETAIGKLDLQAYADVVEHSRRNTDAARIGAFLQARSNVHAVAVDVLAVDNDVAQVYPDPQNQLLRRRHVAVAGGHALLNLDGAPGASTTLGNSSNSPLPMVLTMRCHAR